jgi:hypothetical protein
LRGGSYDLPYERPTKEKTMRKISVVGIVLIALAACCLFLLNPSKAQETAAHNIRIEDYPNFFQNKEPVKIIGLYLGTEPITSGKDFQADKDWIRNLRIEIKNVSDQPIKEVILNFDFPVGVDVNDVPRLERVEIRYGRNYWYGPGRYVDTRNPEILIQPGETAMVSYEFNFSNDPDLLAANLPLIYRKELPNSGYVYLSAAVFGDTDRAWFMRRYLMRDEQNRWISDPSKSYLDGQRSSRIPIKKNKGNSFLAQGQAISQCWDAVAPPNMVTQTMCSPLVQNCTNANDCNGCMYFLTNLARMPGGGYRLQTVNKQCYHTVLSGSTCSINANSTCTGNNGANCIQMFVSELNPNNPC